MAMENQRQKREKEIKLLFISLLPTILIAREVEEKMPFVSSPFIFR